VPLGLAVAEPFDRAAELVRFVRQVADEGIDLFHEPRVSHIPSEILSKAK
jgi:hypothetical protein